MFMVQKKIIQKFWKNKNINLSVSVSDDLHGCLNDGRTDIVFADEKLLSNNGFVPILEDAYYVIAPREWFSGRECVGREELYEFSYIDTDDTYANEYFEKNDPRGEYVIVIEGANEEKDAFFKDMTVEEHVSYYESLGLSRMDAIKATAKDRGVGKSVIYKMVST